jgi:ADP-ribosyl-[dinitrogen reductase] hydrolase
MTTDRYRGSLLGLAVGDALGTTLEFKPPGSFQPISDIVGGGPFGLARGQWTDDTSMALCLAESLATQRRFDPVDQMERYVRWHRDGHLSSTGTCFDIGGTTIGALHRFERTRQPFCGLPDARAAGNGSLMRLAPVPLFFAQNPALAIQQAGDSSSTTHGAQTCIDACRYMAALIVGALQGVPKEDLLADHFAPAGFTWSAAPLCDEVTAVAGGSFKRRNPPEIRGTGYVVQSLEAALWAFYRSADFQEGALQAVNLGDDADTTGAIYGQLAGAYYGVNGIPSAWLDVLHGRAMIEEFADRLLACAAIGPA